MKHQSKQVKVKIHNLGHCPEGIGRVVEGDNKDITVFVDNTTIGDLVTAETYSHKKAYLRAKVVEILEEGETRTQPKCPISKVCGGCQWQHVKYEDQLKAKKDCISSNLERMAGIDKDLVKDLVKDIIPAVDEWNYRAKVQLPLGITKNSRRLLAGYYKPRTHEIVNMKYCPVQPKIFDSIIAEIRELHENYSFEVYNEKTLKGYLRHILLRKSFADNEILLTFVANSRKITPEIQKIADKLMEKFPRIKGITLNINSVDTNVILGPKSKTIAGYNFITERIGDKSYNITDKSFFQVNPQVANQMFDCIREIIVSNGNSTSLLDIYAGVCAMSIYVSDLFEDVIAIESDPSSEFYAMENCKINNVSNISFVNKPANEALSSITGLNKCDWIIMDPPRSGCEKEVLDKIIDIASDNIIYASCNPTTLARDIKILIDAGYKVQSVQPFDMFSHTYHVESVTYLKKNG